MVGVEDDLIAAGAEIIWVLEADASGVPGTAASCMAFFDQFPVVYGITSDQGWCVGDAETMPTPGTFDASPFSVARGFDMVVPRSNMTIVYSTSHGTPSGNDNPTGADVLADVQAIIAGL
ncbi:MAG: hypothetical protein R3F61_15255 [Myxococcota bacterium]